MNVLYTNEEQMMQLCQHIKHIVPLLKKISIKELPEEDYLLKSSYKFHAQNTKKSLALKQFKCCTVRTQFNDDIITIGKPSDYNMIVIDESTGLVKDIYYTTKKDNLIIKVTKGWSTKSMLSFELPVINGEYIEQFEERMFQLACTDDYYLIIRLFQELRLSFRSTFYCNVQIYREEEFLK